MFAAVLLLLAPAPAAEVRAELRIQDDVNYAVAAVIDVERMEAVRGRQTWRLKGPPKFQAVLRAAGQEQRRSGHFHVTVFAVRESEGTLLLRWVIVRDTED